MSFPKWMYHENGQSKIVASAAEFESLEAGWPDTPRKAGTVSGPAPVYKEDPVDFSAPVDPNIVQGMRDQIQALQEENEELKKENSELRASLEGAEPDESLDHMTKDELLKEVEELRKQGIELDVKPANKKEEILEAVIEGRKQLADLSE